MWRVRPLDRRDRQGATHHLACSSQIVARHRRRDRPRGPRGRSGQAINPFAKILGLDRDQDPHLACDLDHESAPAIARLSPRDPQLQTVQPNTHHVRSPSTSITQWSSAVGFIGLSSTNPDPARALDCPVCRFQLPFQSAHPTSYPDTADRAPAGLRVPETYARSHTSVEHERRLPSSCRICRV